MSDLSRTESSQMTSADAGAAALPQHIGRYRVERILGRGGFGLVYLAHDDQLQRFVAIKVPHRNIVARPEDAQIYLTEARTVAALDHPNIVPVYDAGSDGNTPFFVVSKYIEGTTLAQQLKDNRPSLTESADLVAIAAETLHYAHRKGLYHRDIKPSNILLDASGKPFIADFGLALREIDVGTGPRFSGTPAYMSPEQARGEGHRVDGRSDIYSLGVVFYELLTGRRPFHTEGRDELLEQIVNKEVRPPRQWDDAIPKELERICLKALAKRASERYTTAKDLADDLRHFFEADTEAAKPPRSRAAAPALSSPASLATIAQSSPSGLSSDGSLLRIVPKGLRSFDAHDAYFFLELLPGPRDRDGWPDSLRFWKTRIEETEADNTFSVGLIYGPSGCGKSSLVKAGLLPRLSYNVLAVYIEATANETESRLLHGLRKSCPALPDNLGLKETLAALRRGQGMSGGKKVLIVLDQFEQWLHANREQQDTEVVQALRHCDGSKVQCLILVRDDFWLATTRFMVELEINLVQGHNTAFADLFDLDHAKRVLAAFGRAFGKLPENPGVMTPEQKEFLAQAVQDLAQENKIICVRLALFAEMMKGKPWTPATLRDVGGMEGVGVTFLEETFSSPSANPRHRYHQKAARTILKTLLPQPGMDLKGSMRSYAELLEASAYGSRLRDFDDLIHILDNEIRLITPIDPEGKERNDDLSSSARAGQKYYQLTHDYLVQSIREWLTRKQKQTKQGRAELLLADRSAVWNACPENRQLPSLMQWLAILCWTQRKTWTQPQRKMMRKAGCYHVARSACLAVLLLILTVAGLSLRRQIQEEQNQRHAEGLVQGLLVADIAKVPDIVKEIEPYRKWADPLLREQNEKAVEGSARKLRTSLALLPVDPGQLAYLYDRLLDAEPHEVLILCEALARHKDELRSRLWEAVTQATGTKEKQRLRAASALATYDPDNPLWDKVQDQVANDFVGVPAVYLAAWMEALKPVGGRLLTPLSAIFRDGQRRETERSLATDILVDFAANHPEILTKLLLDAEEKQFAVLYARLVVYREVAAGLLAAELVKQLPPDAPEDAKEKLAKQQANAAAALLRLDRPETVWILLKHYPDPRRRSYLIHRLGPMGVPRRTVLDRLEREEDAAIRGALVLSLGAFDETEWSAAEREAVVERVQRLYRGSEDPGLHGAAEWLLRRWKREPWLKQVEQEWAKDEAERRQRLERIRGELARGAGAARPRWYVNGQGQTMVVIPHPGKIWVGSPIGEAEREANEQRHAVQLDRSFALAAKAVTVEQFLLFREDHPFDAKFAPRGDCPVNKTTWYAAAAYCNWLSEKEGLPEREWCYQKNKDGEYAAGMKLAPDYLSRTGYRLPTEAEWEYACRAGTVTSRSYGETEELLTKYAWYMKNSARRTWPVGSLKPNEWGLFDMHGNVWNWCQERYKENVALPSGRILKDVEDGLDIIDTQLRVLRGGSSPEASAEVRAARRISVHPGRSINYVGFRLARTFR